MSSEIRRVVLAGKCVDGGVRSAMDLAAAWCGSGVRLLVALEVEAAELERLDLDGLFVDGADDIAVRPAQQHLRLADVHGDDRELLVAGHALSRSRGAQHEPGNARRCVGRRAQPALGDTIERRSVRVWSQATKAAGLEGLTFHDLRRANATALVLDGVDLKTAQTRLGHSDPRMTLAIYAQASTDADRAAAELLGLRFMPSRGAVAGLANETARRRSAAVGVTCTNVSRGAGI